MSILTKTSIIRASDTDLHFKIERIHPDAPDLVWMLTQDAITIKKVLLFRLLELMESYQLERKELFEFYKKTYHTVSPQIAEEEGEVPALNEYFQITDYGSDFLESAANILIKETLLIEKDLHQNWENGLLNNFNPYKDTGAPYLMYQIIFEESPVDTSLAGLYHFSALSNSSLSFKRQSCQY